MRTRLLLTAALLVALAGPSLRASRDFEADSNQYLSVSGVGNLQSQMSVGMFYTPESSPSGLQRWLIAKGRSTDGADVNFAMQHRNTGTERLELYWTTSSGVFVEYYFNQTLTNGTRYHVGCSVDWTTNPDTVACYLDAVSKSLTLSGSNNGTPSVTSTQQTRIAVDHLTTASNDLDGMLAEVFITADVVPQAKWTMLAAGVAPSLALAGHSFEGYWPLWGAHSPEVDVTRGHSATVTGATAAVHPPILYPRGATYGRWINPAVAFSLPPGGMLLYDVGRQ